MMGWCLIWLYRFLCFFFILLHSQLTASSSFSSSSKYTPQLCLHDQSFALLQFKSVFSFDNDHAYKCGPTSRPKMESWKEGSDCCLWDGVTCDWVTGHVIGLDLSCSWLHGTIPSNSTIFFQLPYLQRLNLAFNSFDYSRISSTFGQFTSLTYLNLSSSNFIGQIPSEISHLSKLVSLDLSGSYSLNRKDQERPSLYISGDNGFKLLVQNLTELRDLVLDGVHLSSVVADSLTNLSSSLTTLSLFGSGLRGKFPENIFHLPNLQTLNLRGNHYLTGHFPKFNWSSPLRLLDLSSTSFYRGLPDSITNLKSLNGLYLSNCQFSGSIPISLGNLTQITNLELSTNHFNGLVPSSLSNLEQLTYIDLSSNNFGGQIPEVFANLRRLTVLKLYGNNFNGPFPSSVSNLTQLHNLDFSFNQLTGPIPSHISGLPNLAQLDLSNNSLDGTIPSWLVTLPSLWFFDLSQNRFSALIDKFQCTSLEWIDLSSNKLHGPFHNSIFKLVNLTSLHLSSNNLTGSVKQDMFVKFKNLMFLDLSYNSLSLSTNNNVNFTLPTFEVFGLLELKLSSCMISEFPNFLRNQENLQFLDLSNNKIQGRIPKWAYGMWKDSLAYLNLSHNFLTSLEQLPWNNLAYVDLHSNLLQGPLLFPHINTTRVFSISNNKLTAEIPSSICNASSLIVLNLSNNRLSGTIPQCLGNISDNLSVLDLRMNNFHGTIPQTFANSSRLRNLDLNGNQLEGPVPQSLVNCKRLEVLDLGNNLINGTFPYWLETLPELQVLVLRSNRFYGPLKGSKAINSFINLRIIDLSNNNFSGHLSTRYFNNLQAMMTLDGEKMELQYMGEMFYQDSVMVTTKGLEIELVKILTIFTTIDLSKNRFQGEIPISVGKLKSLRGLNFSHNSFSGNVPSSLRNLTMLESLDLSSNKLVGEIPQQLTDLTFLAVLNFSENHLKGPVPRGKQFDTFQNDSYIGNVELCGSPLSKKCGDDEAPQTRQSIFQREDDSESAGGFDWKVTLMGYGCGTVFGLVMGYLMFSTGKPEWLVRIVEEELHSMVTNMKKYGQRRGGRREIRNANGVLR